jgi:hypothetical protein
VHDRPPIVVEALTELPLAPSQPAIYDRPIELALLHRDPDSGAEHYVVRYPVGLNAERHWHSSAHTIVVLEGSLMVNGTVIGPGSYCHFPAHTAMHHQPAEGTHCRFLLLFDGPFDVHLAVR